MQKWQSCYTNTGSQDNSDKAGWSNVEVSENIPPSALEGCTKHQITNSRIEKAMLDADGNALNLFEMISEKEYSYIIRTQYGLVDQRGRANMFSHAYIASTRDFLKDPNCLLSIADLCFAKDRKSANEMLHKTITQYPTFYIDEVLNLLNMDAETYKNVLKTVYTYARDEKLIKPVNVFGFDDAKQMRAFLYILYMGLPNFLCRRFSVTSAVTDNLLNRNLVLTKTPVTDSKIKLQFDYRKCSDEYLDRNLQSMYEILDEFVDMEDEIEQEHFYAEMEKNIADFGKSNQNDENNYKVMYSIMNNMKEWRTKDEQKLLMNLVEVLSMEPENSSLLDQYLAFLIKEFVRRNMSLNENLEKRAGQFVAKMLQGEFDNAWEDYQLNQFAKLDHADAIRKLSGYRKEERVALCRSLLKTRRSKDLIEKYYVEKIAASHSMSEVNEQVKECYELKLFTNTLVQCMEKTMDSILQREYLEIWKDPHGDLTKIMDLLHDQERILSLITKRYDVKNAMEKSRRKFWEIVVLKNIHFDDASIAVYRKLECKHENCELTFNIIEIKQRMDEEHEILKAASEYPLIEQIFKDLDEIFKAKEEQDESFTLAKNEIRKRISMQVLKKFAQMEKDGYVVSMDSWLMAANGARSSRKNTTCFEFLDRHADMEPNFFKISKKEELRVVVLKSKLLQEEEFCQQAKDYAQTKGMHSKQVKRWLDFILPKESKGGIFGFIKNVIPSRIKGDGR